MRGSTPRLATHRRYSAPAVPLKEETSNVLLVRRGRRTYYAPKGQLNSAQGNTLGKGKRQK